MKPFSQLIEEVFEDPFAAGSNIERRERGEPDFEMPKNHTSILYKFCWGSPKGLKTGNEGNFDEEWGDTMQDAIQKVVETWGIRGLVLTDAFQDEGVRVFRYAMSTPALLFVVLTPQSPFFQYDDCSIETEEERNRDTWFPKNLPKNLKADWDDLINRAYNHHF